MPLDFADKASLALRLVSARFLDDSETPHSAATSVGLQAGRGTIVAEVDNARIRVQGRATVTSHLKDAANKLRTVSALRPSDMLDRAAVELDRIAEKVHEGNGDGPACVGMGALEPCSCGILDLACIIEQEVRQAYSLATALAAPDPEVSYVTWLIGSDVNNDNLRDVHVIGSTDIRTSPRTVTFEIRNCELFGKELCQLAYISFHELVCHGFQTGEKSNGRNNAHPTCHWTEGWMDSLAYEMAGNWVLGPNGGPHPWLPFGGTAALAHVQSHHDVRYQAHRGLNSEDAKIRRAAREAVRRLTIAFEQNGLARSQDEAKGLTNMFSMAANAHADADCTRLKRLCERLQALLLSKARNHKSAGVAIACLEFLENGRNINNLEKELDRYLSES